VDTVAHPDMARFLRSWVRHLAAANRSAKTIKTYTDAAAQLADYLAAKGRPTDPTDIERGDVEAFIAHLLATRSASTAATRYRGLQQLFKWRVEEGEL
jgi:integrase/recombinase XerC